MTFTHSPRLCSQIYWTVVSSIRHTDHQFRHAVHVSELCTTFGSFIESVIASDLANEYDLANECDLANE
jgi:hypothetical protein